MKLIKSVILEMEEERRVLSIGRVIEEVKDSLVIEEVLIGLGRMIERREIDVIVGSDYRVYVGVII